MARLTPKNAPAGSRVLVKDDLGYNLHELLVVEWSPKGRALVRYPNGNEAWKADSDIPVFVERLSMKTEELRGE